MTYKPYQMYHYAVITKNGRRVKSKKLGRPNEFLYISEAQQMCDDLNKKETEGAKGLINKIVKFFKGALK